MNPKVIEKIDELRNDSLHGAGWLSRLALSTLNLAVDKSQAHTVAEFIDETKIVAAKLTNARPSMISITNYVNQFLHQVMLEAQNGNDLASLKAMAKTTGSDLIQLSKKSASRATEYGSGIISSLDTVITCSYSSTVCKSFELAKKNEEKFHVIAIKSMSQNKAFGEITAKQLKKHQVPVEIVPDESIHLGVAKADKALVGADSILADGSAINGIPSFRLAHEAKERGIPFYTVCETAKFDVQSHIAEASKPELGLEKIPPELLTGIITEKGIMNPDMVIAYIKEMTHLFL